MYYSYSVKCPHCGVRAPVQDGCDCSEYESEPTATTTTLRIARVARPNILPGDVIRVTTGFTYKENGKRTGYLRPEYACVVHGPLWPDYNAATFAERKALYIVRKA